MRRLSRRSPAVLKLFHLIAAEDGGTNNTEHCDLASCRRATATIYPAPLLPPWVPKRLSRPSRRQRSSSFSRPTRSHAHRCSCLTRQHGGEQGGLVTLTFDLESGVRFTCDVGYLYANFSLPRPLCSRLRPDVSDRQTDRQTSDKSIV